MANLLALLTINIGIDPEIQKFGGLLLTWHGVFTALGIAAGVYMAVIMGRHLGFLEDDAYTAALIAIPGGIVGARGLFVVERYGETGLNNWVDAFRINEGGISIYGAILGGIVGGLVYAWFRKMNIPKALDGAAFGALVGMAVGRVGDLINGEHFANVSSLPWAVRYTNLNSPSVLGANSPCGLNPLAGLDTSKLCAQHPAVGYEMVGDLLIFGLLFLILRYARRDGVTFFSFLLLYSLMRFGVSELRLDSRVIIAGLTTPQVTSLFIIPMALVGLVVCWRRPAGERPAYWARPAPIACPYCQASGQEGPFCAQCGRFTRGRATVQRPTYARRYFGSYLLELTLFVLTLGVGWYIWLFFTAKTGQTPAKRLLNLYDFDAATGQPLSKGKVWMREVVVKQIGVILLGTVLLPLGVLNAALVFFNPSRQAGHDRMLGTVVVYAPNGPPAR